MSTPWFVAREGQQVGPMTDEALRALAAERSLLPSQLIWREGWASWLPASAVPGLFDLTQNASDGSAPAMPPLAMPPLAMPAFVPQYASPSSAFEAPGQSAGIRMLIPVGRSAWAIAAGYLGLFSVLLLPAPLALIISIIAIRDIRRHTNRHGMGRAIFGLVMGGLFTIGLTLMIFSIMSR